MSKRQDALDAIKQWVIMPTKKHGNLPRRQGAVKGLRMHRGYVPPDPRLKKKEKEIDAPNLLNAFFSKTKAEQVDMGNVTASMVNEAMGQRAGNDISEAVDSVANTNLRNISEMSARIGVPSVELRVYGNENGRDRIWRFQIPYSISISNADIMCEQTINCEIVATVTPTRIVRAEITHPMLHIPAFLCEDILPALLVNGDVFVIQQFKDQPIVSIDITNI